MTWRTAFTNLAAISVDGVTASYDLDALPGALPAADLPALLPLFTESAGWTNDGRRALETLTYDGSAWLAALHIEHVLIWSPVWAGAGLLDALPALINAVDAYLDAVSADGTLSGALHEPLVIERVQVGEIEYGGARYYGARFRHRWVRVVG